MYTGIYQITNITNGKRYVGSSVNFAKRWSGHRKDLEKGVHPNKKLQNSWDKNGAEAFVFTKLLVCARKDLIFYEQRVIDVLNPEYNLLKVAGSTLGAVVSEDVKRRLSIVNTGRKHSDDTRKKMSAAARNMTPEHRANLSASARKRKHTPETREKLSLLYAGTKRQPHTPETKAKMSAIHKGRIFSEEHRAKLCVARRKRVMKKVTYTVTRIDI